MSAAIVRIERALATMPVGRVPLVMLGLASLLSVGAVRMIASPVRDGGIESPDENLSIDEAARRLGVSKDYLYRHARKLPFARRIGRRLLFSARGLERWNRRLSP